MVFGLFGKARFLDKDTEDWCLETWSWLMRNLGGMARLSQAPLVTPSRDYFPPTETEGHERAIYIFGLVKHLMGLGNWPCEFEAFDRIRGPGLVNEITAVHTGGAPNGTFRIEDGTVIIAYASDLIDQPRHLIATLAHELAHYMIATIREPIPGGRELHELATELTVAYAGLGVFGANHAFSFEQHRDAFSEGWRSQRNGYFSERTWAFAVALFAALKGEAVDPKVLKPNVAEMVKAGGKYFARNPSLLEPLRSIA